MEYPKSIQTDLTNEIMAHFYGEEFNGAKFNRAYEHIHQVLSKCEITYKQ